MSLIIEGNNKIYRGRLLCLSVFWSLDSYLDDIINGTMSHYEPGLEPAREVHLDAATNGR